MPHDLNNWHSFQICFCKWLMYRAQKIRLANKGAPVIITTETAVKWATNHKAPISLAATYLPIIQHDAGNDLWGILCQTMEGEAYDLNTLNRAVIVMCFWGVEIGANPFHIPQDTIKYIYDNIDELCESGKLGKKDRNGEVVVEDLEAMQVPKRGKMGDFTLSSQTIISSPSTHVHPDVGNPITPSPIPQPSQTPSQPVLQPSQTTFRPALQPLITTKYQPVSCTNGSLKRRHEEMESGMGLSGAGGSLMPSEVREPSGLETQTHIYWLG